MLLCSWDFPGQNACVWLPFPSPGDLPDPVIESASPILSGGFFITEPPRKSTENSVAQTLTLMEISRFWMLYQIPNF